LVAVNGYLPFYKTVHGKIKIEDDGSNTWSDSGENHYYLVEDRPPSEVQDFINTLIMHQPR